ncbi:MAG: DUF5624 domain-containing protein [Proteobacteria bacterium]|nr:DUF5624 domain-containing protein [Pseudomonadota bacterium]
MDPYVTPTAFKDLYYDFTGYMHPGYPKDRTAIAQDLAVALGTSTQTENGPLIVATETGVYIYDSNKGHQLVAGASTRASEDSGFYEITSISHIGPAIAYLATLKELGQDTWEKHINTLLTHIRQVRDINAASIQDHWLTRLDCPAWRGREQSIKNLIDYSCFLAGNYLVKIQKNPHHFSSQDVFDNFLQISDEKYPIPYNTIMIGTFSLAALQAAYGIYNVLSDKKIDWENAKVLIHNQAGTNYGAGLTPASNWIYPTIVSLAGARLRKERIMIVPYATIPASVGNEQLSEDDFNMLANRIWGALYARSQTANLVFSRIVDIEVPSQPALPGDYDYTKADQIDDFIRRLKFSTGNITQMLSNTVGFWIAGEASEKRWEVEKMDIPGLTHGLPEGFSAYPEKSPEISE